MSGTDEILRNDDDVRARAAWLVAAPPGVLYDGKSKVHRIVVRKDDDVVRMYFVGSNPGVETPTYSGAMSAMLPADPLDLSPTPYNQAMMLALLWKPEPAHVYVIGFAGGRIPLVLHSLFPHVRVESTDIDAGVVPLSERFFAMKLDARQQVFIEDGREYLERQPERKYDIIVSDAFRGTGLNPFHLGTREFFDSCGSRLAPCGVVAVNLVLSDALFGRKLATMESVFRHVYVKVDRTITAFGTDESTLNPETFAERAAAVGGRHRFGFPYVERARALVPLREAGLPLPPRGEGTALLVDGRPPEAVAREAPGDASGDAHVGRNDRCPCGSGKKYKKCHGRPR